METRIKLAVKTIAATLLIVVTFFSCREKNTANQPSKDLMPKETTTEFEVNEEIHNFGTLNSGENVSFSFVLINTGNIDLEIKNVESDCGCITARYGKEPVKPGDSAIIEVGFDTSGLFGRQYKPVAVETNTVKKIMYLAVVADVKNDMFEINN